MKRIVLVISLILLIDYSSQQIYPHGYRGLWGEGITKEDRKSITQCHNRNDEDNCQNRCLEYKQKISVVERGHCMDQLCFCAITYGNIRLYQPVHKVELARDKECGYVLSKSSKIGKSAKKQDCEYLLFGPPDGY